MNTRPKIPANARNLNCCVIGSSGSGKTRFWLTPQLLQAHSSFVVVDPKGGVLSQAGYFLQKKKGYKVKVFNSIEVEAPKLFDRMARRFNVDYAFYKTGPDKYLLFFKAGQADAITACFESYSRKLLGKSKSSRIPIREQLKQAAEQLAQEKPKTKERAKEVVREER